MYPNGFSQSTLPTDPLSMQRMNRARRFCPVHGILNILNALKEKDYNNTLTRSTSNRSASDCRLSLDEMYSDA